MIVRGYLTGSAWRAYKNGAREICGVPIPDGMREHQRFEHPVITPTTKAEIGTHDEDISKEEILRRGLVSPEDYAKIEDYALRLFQRGTEMAAPRSAHMTRISPRKRYCAAAWYPLKIMPK